MQKTDHQQKIDISEYLQRVIATISKAHRDPHLNVSYTLDIKPIVCSSMIAMNVAQLANELIQNSLRHAYKGRSIAVITVMLNEHDNQCLFVVADDGNGIKEESDPYKSASGLHLVSNFVQNIKGTIRVIKSHGTRIEVSFPLGE